MWRRYSNTLLVSLNNRIAIREGRGAAVRTQAITFAVDTISLPTAESKMPSGALLAEHGAGRETTNSVIGT